MWCRRGFEIFSQSKTGEGAKIGTTAKMADFASIFGAPKNLCLTPSPLPVCKGGTGEILTNRCPWGGSAGWRAQTAPTLLLPLPTARICVRQVQLIHSLVRLIVFFAQQGGRVFSFSMSLKKQGITFRLFCRVLGGPPHDVSSAR